MRFLVMLLVGFAAATSTRAAVPTVRVGKIDSERQCSLYQMAAGRHREAGSIDAYGASFASETSWSTYLVRDCVDNFASLRTSVQAALAASGKLAVVPGTSGGAYVVSGRISDVSGGGPAAPVPRMPGSGAAISSTSTVVSMDVTLRDAAGRIVYGGVLTKALQTGFNMETAGMSSGTSRSGQGLYTELQHEVALAVARVVAFRIEPLRVTTTTGPRLALNYGAPLLQLGSIVQVTTSDNMIVRYTVTAAGSNSAQAEYYGGQASGVRPGDVATVIEAEDPAANARRFEKVELP